jgi:hypothetical protein
MQFRNECLRTRIVTAIIGSSIRFRDHNLLADSLGVISHMPVWGQCPDWRLGRSRWRGGRYRVWRTQYFWSS